MKKTKEESKIELGALFYPVRDINNVEIGFDNLFIPFIYKEIYLEGIFIDVVNQKKDMIICDLGSNIGCTIQYFLPYAKKIYGVEPAPEAWAALTKNKEFNHWDKVSLTNAAISDVDGEATLNFHAGNRTCNSITNSYGQGTTKVRAIALDTFFKENNIDEVDFVKMDIESAEDIVLRSESFARVAPKIKSIMLEFHKPNWMELVGIMEKLGFTCRRYESSAIICLFFR